MLQQLSAILILNKVTDAKSYAVFIISNYFTPKPQTVIRQSVFLPLSRNASRMSTEPYRTTSSVNSTKSLTLLLFCLGKKSYNLYVDGKSSIS